MFDNEKKKKKKIKIKSKENTSRNIKNKYITSRHLHAQS